jgi:energy-converting hydrogenase A subunit C
VAELTPQEIILSFSQLSSQEVALSLCALVGLYASLRVVGEKRTLRKLPYLNVLGFAVSGSLALLIPHPLAIVAATAFFVGSTLESNAIASAYAGGRKE